MENFDQQLMRLKQALGVVSDQEAAAALGLSKAALSDRKKRGVFPEDKLYALAAKRPDLGLDVLHVLMGEKKTAALNLTLAELEAALAWGADKGGPVAEQLKRAAALVEEKNRPLPQDEQLLLETYRELNSSDKKKFLKLALRFPGEEPGVTQTFHSTVKGGVAGRDIVKSK